jgi:polyisoprenoid-binding protein YceI
MKSQAALVTLALATATATPALGKDLVRGIDPARSTVQWHGSKVVGGAHTGKVRIKSGSLTLAGDQVKAAEVVVDLSSIVNEDLTDAAWNQKLVGHLKSADFFDVEKFPTASLTIERVERAKDGKTTAHGVLTVKGKSSPVNFPVTERETKDGPAYKAELAFDRTIYDIRYGSGKFFTGLGDKMIADEVRLDVEVVLQPQVSASK